MAPLPHCPVWSRADPSNLPATCDATQICAWSFQFPTSLSKKKKLSDDMNNLLFFFLQTMGWVCGEREADVGLLGVGESPWIDWLLPAFFSVSGLKGRRTSNCLAISCFRLWIASASFVKTPLPVFKIGGCKENLILNKQLPPLETIPEEDPLEILLGKWHLAFELPCFVQQRLQLWWDQMKLRRKGGKTLEKNMSKE